MASDPFAPLDPGPKTPFESSPLGGVARSFNRDSYSVTGQHPAPGAETEPNPAAIPEEGHPGSGSDGRPQRPHPIRRYQGTWWLLPSTRASHLSTGRRFLKSRKRPGALSSHQRPAGLSPQRLPSPQPESLEVLPATSPAVSRRCFSSQPPAERQPRSQPRRRRPQGQRGRRPVPPDLRPCAHRGCRGSRDDEERRAS